MRFDSPSNYGQAQNTAVETTTVAPAASLAQVKYINDLRTEGQRYADTIAAHQGTERVVPNFPNADQYTMSQASDAIKNLKAIVAQKRSQVKALGLTVQRSPEASAQPVAPAQRAYTVVTDGMWVIGDVANGGTCFKVQYNKAMGDGRRLYAKRLTADGMFVHAPGAIKTLAYQGRKMTLEEAKFYGKLYGTCVRCGRTLTDEGSIEAGIGPICATKF